MIIPPVGAELLPAGGRTDMTKLIVGFRNFANSPKTTSGAVSELFDIIFETFLPPSW